jgi:cyanophycin synthetase
MKHHIEILNTRYLAGPNIWTFRPVIEACVDIGSLEQHPSNTLPGFYERLTAWLPGLIEHRCSVGVRGGFLQRLRQGTWAAHIMEHVALELQCMAGMQTGFGKARETSKPGVYKLTFRTREESVGREALHLARDIVVAAANERDYALPSPLARLKEMVDDRCLGPSTAHIVDAATDRKIPHIRLNEGNLVQLGYGAARRRIWTAETDRTSAIAEEIAHDKDLTKTLLKAAGVPVPEGQLVHSAAEAWEAAKDIGLPVALKPYDGNHGRGVSLDLSEQQEVLAAYQVAEDQSGGGVIVEKFIPGDEHRLLVVGKQVIAASKGEAAWITGDGVHCVTQLVDMQLNSDPRRGTGEDAPLGIIEPAKSPEILIDLDKAGFTPDSIPNKDKRVLIQRNGNVAMDVTDSLHPSIAQVAALAARVVGLDIAGIDMVLEDASKPLHLQSAAVIEVNASPGLLAHIKPANAPARPVGEAIISHLFKPEQDGRIPIVGIHGSKETTPLARLIAWLLYVGGRQVGLACRDGMFLNDRRADSKDCATWEAGQRILMNASVQTAVIENDAALILNQGLAYDKCSVGIVTDVSWHESLGSQDILNVEQCFKVARTQIDVILPSGVAVINAQEPQAQKLAELCDGEVTLYSLDPAQELLMQHIAIGKNAVTINDGWIVMQGKGFETGSSLIRLDDLRLAKSLQAATLLAAVAALWALNMSAELIAAGLRTFDAPTYQE